MQSEATPVKPGPPASARMVAAWVSLFAAGGFGSASFAQAQDTHGPNIHKCATDTGVAYQSTPCGAGQIVMAVLTLRPAAAAAARTDLGATESRDATSRAANDAANREGSVAPNGGQAVLGQRARWIPHRAGPIAAGMSDDQVLNTPDWGVPTHITRSRDKRAWREVWVYEPRAGGLPRQLSFTNGTLTDVVFDRVGTLPTQVALASEPILR